MNRNAERRRHPRVEADFTLTLDSEAPDQEPVLVKDVSRAGVCCFLPEPVGIMTEVAMRLQIPDENGHVSEVRAEGAVVRCDPLADPAPDGPAEPTGYEVAIFFLQMDEDHREVIERYVDSRLATRPAGQTT